MKGPAFFQWEIITKLRKCIDKLKKIFSRTTCMANFNQTPLHVLWRVRTPLPISNRGRVTRYVGVSLVPRPCYAPRHKGQVDYNLIQGKIALNLWCIRHNAVRILTNQSTGRFAFHLALLPLIVREPGDQATLECSVQRPLVRDCPFTRGMAR